MPTLKKTTANRSHNKPKSLVQQVKQLANDVPLEKLRAGLKKVASARGLQAATLNLHFHSSDDPYYNVYRYAFFGKPPEIADIVEERVANAKSREIFRASREAK